jgi:hypothetical protein
MEQLMRYSVSGVSRPLYGVEIMHIRSVLEGCREVTEFTTGGARGVDTAAAFLAQAVHPLAKHRVLLPDQPYHPVWDTPGSARDFEVKRISGGYMARNDALVACADILIAFPERPDEEVRSGTWATVRRARKAGITVVLAPLESAARQERAQA